MKTTSFVAFKKKREVGEILNDSFKFFRKNAKPLFKVLMRTAGIPFLIVIIVNAYNAYSLNTVSYVDPSDPFALFKTSTVIIGTLLNYLFTFIYASILFITVNCAIVSYINNNGVINESETLSDVKKFMGSGLLTGFIKYVLLIIGIVLCFAPGIYLSVPMMLFFPILICERKSVGDAFNKSFEMSKEGWGMSFLSLLVVMIILIAVGSAFALPAALLGMVEELTGSGYMEDDGMTISDILLIVISIISSACQYIIYIIVPITGTLVYYNLNERKTQTGAMERIESLGAGTFDA